MGFFRDLAEGFSDVFLGGAERKQAKAQRQAAKQGQQLIAEQFQQTASGLQPFIESGTAGLPLLQQEIAGLSPQAQAARNREFVENFQESPEVAFLREQGLRGIDRGAAAAGGLGGGARLKRLARFSQGLAMQDFARQQARRDALDAARRGLISQQIQTGLGAATGLGGLGAQQAGQQSNLLNLQGQLRGQELAAGPEALRGLLGQGLGIAALGGAFGPQGVLGGLFRTGAPAAAGGGLSLAGGGFGSSVPAMPF